MNKIAVYFVLAIFLGSVTMLMPLAMLGPSNLLPDDNYLDIVSESGGEKLEGNDTLTDREASVDQSNDTGAWDPSPIESARNKSSLWDTNVASNLSSIGLITVPSFIIAMGVFVYLKKRT